MRSSKAVFAGSFDPFTIGHRYVAKIAASLFDEVFVVIADNESKKDSLFSVIQRETIIKMSLNELYNISVVRCPPEKFVFELAKELGASIMVHGLRYTCEYEYELKLANENLEIGGLSTIGVFPEDIDINATAIRQLIRYGRYEWHYYVCSNTIKYIESIVGDSRNVQI